MKIEVDHHWMKPKYFVIIKNNYVFSSSNDSEFFNLFKQKIINLKYMKNNFNAIILEKNYYIMYFKTREEAQKVIDELLLPYIVMEKLVEECNDEL